MPTVRQLLEIIAIQAEIIKLGPDLGAVLALAVERTLPLIAADGAVIELAEGEHMVYRAVAGIAQAHHGLRLKENHSLSGVCVRTGLPLRCKDIENDPRVDRDACRRVGLRSMLVVPLLHDDQTIGVLKAISIRVNAFRRRDETLLGLLSESIGAAMYFATQLGRDDLFQRATHDPLTGLANRSLFMERLRNITAQRHRAPVPAGVVMLDMDGLKQINDAYGHRIGDVVLREFARRIHAAARQSDTVARIGGDEFAIILQPVDATPEGIVAAIGRIEQQIDQPFAFEGLALSLRASIGTAAFPTDSGDVDGLLELADQRMYAAKHARSGRSR